jgi:AcrR family transcriptional regulator
MAKRGRPRSFNRDHALCQARQLFWARGYEGVRLADLQEAMGGIAAPSFYAAFGSKEALFREIVELYRRTEGRAPAEALSGGGTAREAIESTLRAAAECYSQPGKPSGCLLLVGAGNYTHANSGIGGYLDGMRRERQTVFSQRLQRGVQEGDLPQLVDIGALAFFYITVMDGLAIQARDGSPREALMAAIDGAMAAWETLTRPRIAASDARASASQVKFQPRGPATPAESGVSKRPQGGKAREHFELAPQPTEVKRSDTKPN